MTRRTRVTSVAIAVDRGKPGPRVDSGTAGDNHRLERVLELFLFLALLDELLEFLLLLDMAGEESVVDGLTRSLRLLDLPRCQVRLLLKLVRLLVVLLVREVVLLGARQLVQGLEELLVFGESTTLLVHCRGERALLLLRLFQIDLGHLDPA